MSGKSRALAIEGSAAKRPAKPEVAVAWPTVFARLFEETFPSLHRYLNRLGGDTELASDLAQEAFVRLYRRGALPDDPQAWLFTVATNLLRNAKRRQATRARLTTLGRGLRVHSDPPPPPDRRAGSTDERDRVRQALECLKDRDRSLLLLAAEGHSYRTIAAVVGLREASVGTLLRRARASFRSAFGEAPHGT